MEIQAVIEGIKAAKKLNPNAPITIITDSKYVVNTMTKNWSRKANKDLWKELDDIIDGRDIKYEWVKGHSTNKGNQRADELANMGVDGSQVMDFQQSSLLTIKSEPTPIINEEYKEPESSHQSDTFDNISTEEKSPFISIDELPSDPEFDINILMEQQRKTELVAPIALELLKVEDQRNSPTRHFQGKYITIDYDGYHLTIKNNQDDSIKMKARFVGVDPATRKTQWLSELPENSPGLTDADVQKWTSASVKNYIKQKIVEQEVQKRLSLAK